MAGGTVRGKKELRTIFWDETRGEVVMVDQTALPSRFRYVRYSDYVAVGDAIRRMVVRGAPAIGVAAAMGLALCAAKSKAATREELLRELEQAANHLSKTRPTAVNLFWALERVMKVARKTEGGVDAVRERVLQEAKAMAEEDVKVNKQMGRLGASLLADGDRVLTLCK